MACLSVPRPAAGILLSISCVVYWYSSRKRQAEDSNSQTELSALNARRARQPIGCYADNWDRDLPVSMGSISLEECATKCKDYKYFGRQAGNECWCGNSYGKYGKTTGCNCDPNVGYQGYFAQCVYAQQFSPIGCYVDMGTRDLPVSRGIASLEECAVKCKGYNYFSRQGQGECFCGDTYGKYGETAGCACDSNTNVGLWKNCVYHLRTPCTAGLTISNSDRTASAPCHGVDGEECDYQCDAGYLAVGRHVCQTYSVAGNHVIDHAFFGGRCDKLCLSSSAPCKTGQEPVRVKSSENGERCLQTTCMQPDQALLKLTRGGYELFQLGRNPTTGIYIDHVDVAVPAGRQNRAYASIDATAVGLAVECVAANLGIISMQDAQQKVLTTMHALTGRLPSFTVPRNPRGFFPTFINSDTGQPYGDKYATDTTGMIGMGSLFVQTCFENSDPGSAATQEISSLAEELNSEVQYDSLLCDQGRVTGEGADIPYILDNGNGCSNVISPGPDGYFYYNEMIWIAYLAFHRACGKQPAGQCSNKPIERMWAAWQGRRKNLWYYYGGQGLLTIYPSFLLQLPFYLVHAFNSDPVYTELFNRQWQEEWDYYKSGAFYAGEDGRYGLGAGPTIQWCAGTTYQADMFANFTDGSMQHCRMYSPYAVAGYLPASPSKIRGHLLALLSSGDASYPLKDSDHFVLWRKSLLDPNWWQPDWGITLVDFASEFFGLSTLWLGADFYKRSTRHWPDDLKLASDAVLHLNQSSSSQHVQMEYI